MAKAHTRRLKSGRVVNVRATGSAPGRRYKLVPSYSRANGTTVKAHNRNHAYRKPPKLDMSASARWRALL